MSFYNVGYNSGKYGYLASEYRQNKWRPLRVYSIWSSMLKRCYDGKNRCYSDAYVCELWQDYQEFAKWYNNQPDIKKLGVNKGIIAQCEIGGYNGKIITADKCAFFSLGK